MIQNCQDKKMTVSNSAVFSDANYTTWTLTPGEYDYYNTIFSGGPNGVIAYLERCIDLSRPWEAMIPQTIPNRDGTMISAERDRQLMEAHSVCKAVLVRKTGHTEENVEILARFKATAPHRERKRATENKKSTTPKPDVKKKTKFDRKQDKDSRIFKQFLDKYNSEVQDMCSANDAPRLGTTHI